MENIKSKVIILTGATGGIGEATAKLLAQNGAKLVLAARREDRLQSLADDILKSGGEAIFLPTDVSSANGMQELAQAALQKYGRIDVLVNNAGIMPNSWLNELKIDDWGRMIDVNIKGVLYGIAAVLPAMREQQAGHIINISSLMGHKVVPVTAVYSATKHAVRAITEGLRQEESPTSRIRTTNISPGMVATETAISVLPPEYQDAVAPGSGMALSPDSVARAVVYSINEPDDTAINEITIRPTLQEI
ncbi:NADP-dependent 3-hydroxy acid dehydrogenase YdfG [Paenibacillus rhizosphaerae]|uniref:NADP-dependent 3-hydroxy acid dehydrogenase YdfG n=1 Tax=Paenibacillus rhizosphaerae TaxID=297318 RepID=A0A839TVP4_9BACL|nr:SDR family oxidoreductase [Paenibacillus rhizosphaerae]MBB3130563.1 NADP-dependent 3-hydroxy acid dehydrogenase YdfG [Paenibacillus rhizosphaerae]